jgi:hypothetical protein
VEDPYLVVHEQVDLKELLFQRVVLRKSKQFTQLEQPSVAHLELAVP